MKYTLMARVYGSNDLVVLATENTIEALQNTRFKVMSDDTYINAEVVFWDETTGDTLEGAKSYYIQGMIANNWNNVVDQPNSLKVSFFTDNLKA